MHSSGSRQLQAPFERLTDATETEIDLPTRQLSPNELLFIKSSDEQHMHMQTEEMREFSSQDIKQVGNYGSLTIQMTFSYCQKSVEVAISQARLAELATGVIM